MKKIILRIVFVFMMIAITPAMCGCFTNFPEFDFDLGGSNGESGNTGLSFLQCCYKNETNNFSNLIELYAENTFTSIINIYLGPITNQEEITDLNLTETLTQSNFEYYDSARCIYTNNSGTYYKNSSTSSKWKWSIGGNEISSWETITPFLSEQYKTILNNYKNAYLPCFKIICYEILLNKTPSIFTISLSSNNATVSNINGKTVNDYYTEIKQEYIDKSLYVGISEQNKTNISSYILNNIIGENALNLSNKTLHLIPDGTSSPLPFVLIDKQYTQVINKILQRYYLTVLHQRPNSSVQLIKSSSFASSDMDESDYIEPQCYQSIVLCPNGNMTLSNFMFCLESEYDIDITVHVNYYNSSEKSTLSHSFDCQVSNGSDFDIYDICENNRQFLLTKDITLKYILTNLTEKSLISENTNNYYSMTTLENENTLTHINPESSYYDNETSMPILELCFEQKNQENKPFSFGIFIISDDTK